MEVKKDWITTMGLGVTESQGCQNSMLQAKRISDLQQKKQSLQTLLSSRQKELRQVCLLEAELTGKLPLDFPLEVGEQPPAVHRRAGNALNASSMVEGNLGQRGQMKTEFTGTLHQNIDSDKSILRSKRTVHRGCHTDIFSLDYMHFCETLFARDPCDTSLFTSYLVFLDSTHLESYCAEGLSSSVGFEHRSLSHPRLASGSPVSRLCKTLSPVEIYYEMRTCHNSASSSISDVALKQWDRSPDVAQFLQLASLEGSSLEHTSYIYNSLARRSNSSEALLDHSNYPQIADPRNGMPPKTGPYKSSESLTDSKLRHIYHGSPERQMGGSKDHCYMHSSVNKGSAAGCDETPIDCMSRPLKRPFQSQQHFSVEHIWPTHSALPKSGTLARCNVFPHSQMHLASATASYSPIFVQSYQPKSQVKVTRTKSCGPFTPVQQQSLDNLLVYAYEPTNLLSGSNASSFPNLVPHRTEIPNSTVSCKPSPVSLPALDDSTRSLHKALALEGLREWYLRNALGYSTAARGPDGLRSIPHLMRLPWSVPLGPLYSYPQIPQSTSFHGYPQHDRYVELSLYPEPIASKKTALKVSSADPTVPGTLV